MNHILHLKGRFDYRPNPSRPGPALLPKGKIVNSHHLHDLQHQLESIATYWEQHTEIGGALVSVHYKTVVAKSNRLRALLSERGKSPTDSIRGAKFIWEPNQSGAVTQKHVFTHYVSLPAIKNTIKMLFDAAHIIDTEYNGQISYEATVQISKKKTFSYSHLLSKSAFLKIIRDCFFVESFDIDQITSDITEESIVTLYKTDIETKALLKKFGITIYDDRIINQTTLRLNPDELQSLISQAPYLIAMNVTDLAQLTKDDFLPDSDSGAINIPSPSNEPIVGVIDTQFNTDVYFHEWVEYHNMLSEDIPLRKEDFYHGTEVTSIIVDGPAGNPHLEDGCGRFRVRHFGVATSGRFSSFSILRSIRSIVSNNRDIKVWNLSLGSTQEINACFISPEAAELDRIQEEYDVLFVVAGTNRPFSETKKTLKIGAPADSLNSLVVNSVTTNHTPASYTRVGPVLSFFHKPDLSYYGGDGQAPSDRIAVCRDSSGAYYAAGTSFAAPWITRKMAYLIYIMGLNREVAKALIIDAAAGWERKDNLSNSIGYGVVPIHISQIICSPNDEIRFILTGTAEDFETYTYNLPIPVVKNAHPFYARATLVYFPHCNRNQGVDYTCTEMDIHFGRLQTTSSKSRIVPINGNLQSEEGLQTIYEENARKEYRKWDNVKHISEPIKTRAIPRQAYDSGLWGLCIKMKERMQSAAKQPLPFGVVITLKEMNGINRIDDFKKLCMARNWLVTQLDVDQQINLYNQAEEQLSFE